MSVKGNIPKWFVLPKQQQKTHRYYIYDINQRITANPYISEAGGRKHLGLLLAWAIIYGVFVACSTFLLIFFVFAMKLCMKQSPIQTNVLTAQYRSINASQFLSVFSQILLYHFIMYGTASLQPIHLLSCIPQYLTQTVKETAGK